MDSKLQQNLTKQSVNDFLVKNFINYKAAIQQTKMDFLKILRTEVYQENEQTWKYLKKAKKQDSIKISVEINVDRDELPLKTTYYESIPRNIRLVDSLPLVASRMMTNSLVEVIDGNLDFEDTIKQIKKKISSIELENEQYFMNKDQLFIKVLIINFIKQNPTISSIKIIQEMASSLNKQPFQLQELFLKEFAKRNQMKNRFQPQKQQFYSQQRFFCQICCLYFCSQHFAYLNINIQIVRNIKPKFFNEKYIDTTKENDAFQLDSNIDNPYNCKQKLSQKAILEQNLIYETKNILEKNYQILLISCTNNLHQNDQQDKLKKFQKNFIENLFIFGIKNPCFVTHCLKNNHYPINCSLVYEHQLKWMSKDRLQPAGYQQKIQQVKLKVPLVKQLRDMNIFFEDPYQPCFHEGDCDYFCDCKICLRWCGCSASCLRRFKGCQCQDKCVTQSCECRKSKYDCDPDLCQCGILNDYRQKENEEKKQGTQCIFKCKNSSLYFQTNPRLVLGKSLICEGLGVFAGQNFQKLDYIGEYRGAFFEINQETQLIEEIDTIVGTHFIFFLNDNVQIDGTFFGTKIKFMNHAKKPLINCQCQLQQSQGTQKIILQNSFAKRKIKLGEELYFDYSDQFKTSWKKQFDEALDLYFNQTTKNSQRNQKLKLSDL